MVHEPGAKKSKGKLLNCIRLQNFQQHFACLKLVAECTRTCKSILDLLVCQLFQGLVHFLFCMRCPGLCVCFMHWCQCKIHVFSHMTISGHLSVYCRTSAWRDMEPFSLCSGLVLRCIEVTTDTDGESRPRCQICTWTV